MGTRVTMVSLLDWAVEYMSLPLCPKIEQFFPHYKEGWCQAQVNNHFTQYTTA